MNCCCYLTVLAGYDMIIHTYYIQCKHIELQPTKNKSGFWLLFSNKHASQLKLGRLFIFLNILWRKSQILDYVLTDFMMFHFLFVLFLKLKSLTCELSDLRESLISSVCWNIILYFHMQPLCWGTYPLKWFLPPSKEPLFCRRAVSLEALWYNSSNI